MNQYVLRTDQQKSNFAEKILVTPTASWAVLGGVLPAGQGDDPSSLFSTGETLLESCVQLWALQYIRDMHIVKNPEMDHKDH